MMAVARHTVLTGLPDDGVFRSVAFRQCLSSLRSGAVGRAEALCREVLRSSPGNPHLLRLLAAILARQRRLEEAAGSLGEALQRVPDAADVHYERGVVLAQLARREEALASFERAVDLDPGYPEAWNSRGALLAELGRYGDALVCFDRALAERPDYVEVLVNRGDVFRSLGRDHDALANYTRSLALKPADAATINRCGLALANLGRYPEALDYHGRAIRLSPENPEAHHGLGVVLSKLGHHPAALNSFARVLSLRPDYAEAYVSDAKALVALGRHEEALDSYDRALALDPTLVEALHNRCLVLAELGRLELALGAYDRALAADPGLTQALIGKGNVLAKLERYEEALACFDNALGVNPELGEAQARRADLLDRLNRQSLAEFYCFRANTLQAIDRLAEAIEDYDKAIALCPEYVEPWIGRGQALTELRELTDALACYDRVAALRPDDSSSHANRSGLLRTIGRFQDAIAAADRALAIDPSDIAGLNNRSNALVATGRIAEALECYDRALAADPHRVESHFNRATCLLTAGDLARGWEEYEWRWRLPGFEKGQPRSPLPLWLGQEDIAGRRILLYAEQGNGDTIQFCRYVPLIAARGATVVLAVQPLLSPLMASLPGARHIVGPGDRAPDPQFRCPLLSLPLAFGTRLETIPAEVPYLAPPPAKLHLWQEKLGPRRGPRVGIAWSGNRRHKSDHERSLSLEELAPIAGLGIPLHCLQRELRPRDLADFAMFANIEFYSDALRDFADTAALIAQLDLVISVDTAAAHLAGAMGKPVWLLLSYTTDWRWMTGREDSPWYPTMRLFRQEKPGEWHPVIERVRDALACMIASGC